ncbi:SDH family Clp fold serine proteinase [Aliarcobacter butzleri]|uniref:SDH family Clp fold serine proteinase n=1 Tax=Aliarcobacter butzleri TaxID=28197 RepID=UPI001EDADB2F|nr:ATP-dependent Clp protease proteolytic subunit [Aliarcobacter butzleri]MCG3683872.1 ATP-dependent Clp protease proteolytic subunit [Aliarcobacter butzleri]
MCEVTDEKITNKYMQNQYLKKLILMFGYNPNLIIGKNESFTMKGSTLNDLLDLSTLFKFNECLKENPNIDLHDQLKKTIQKFEELRGRPCLIYYSSTSNIEGHYPINVNIINQDVDSLYDSLNNNDKFLNYNEIDFVLNTPGGYIESANQIINLLRKRFKVVNIIVPRMAFSAGTIISLGGDEIVVLDKSTFSMVNPSINNIDTYYLKRINFFSHIFSYIYDKKYRKDFRISPSIQAYKAEKNIKIILTNLLNNYAIKEKNLIKKFFIVRNIVNKLTNYENYYSHQYPISVNDLMNLGLNIVEAKNDLKKLMQQIDVINKNLLKQHDLAKLIITDVDLIYSKAIYTN